MSDDPKISPSENGPFIAHNIPNLRMRDGTMTHPKKPIALCRCGGSENMPFCDGQHKLNKFDGAPNPDIPAKDRIYKYEGKDVTVHYNKILCSHAGECGALALAVFNPKQKPWVQPDNGTLEQIKDVIAACPSGALKYTQGSDAIDITIDDVAISVEPNGPYHVTNVPIKADYWAKGQGEKKYVLCRCGLSKNKPFCDGTHYDKGWKDQT